MVLFLIVYEEVLDGEVISLLDRTNLDRYIKWDKVKGKWREKHMDNHVWPGKYHVILTMLEKSEVEMFKKEIKKLQQKFSADEIWGWLFSLEEIV